MQSKPLTTFLIVLALGALSVTPVIATDASATQETAICHVCRVHGGETEPETVVATAEHNDTTYGFCSADCRDQFVESPSAFVPPTLPRSAPAFDLVDLNGETVSLETRRGQWTLIDFWATWCQPCVTDLPKLTALHERHAERGFAVVGISIDEGRRAAKKVARMVERKNVAHPIALDSEETPAWAAYNVVSVPAQFLIDPEGQIVAQWSGTIDLEQVEAEVVKALGDG